MSVFQSSVVPSSDAFQRNRADMLSVIDELRALEARAVTASGKRWATFEKRGQIPPHERIARLLDPGCRFSARIRRRTTSWRRPTPSPACPGANSICGIGFVRGARCMVWAKDSGIRAGSVTHSSLPTALSLQDIALRQKLPLIHLVESAGANLMSFLVETWAGFGGVFKNLARPALRPSPAGVAYMPGMLDYVIGVKENGLAAVADMSGLFGFSESWTN